MLHSNSIQPRENTQTQFKKLMEFYGPSNSFDIMFWVVTQLCFAIVSACQLFCQKSTKPSTIPALKNWIARLLYFSPRVIHKPEKAMAIPDALSQHYLVYQPPVEDSDNKLFGLLIAAACENMKDPEMALNTQNNLISNLSHDKEDEIGCGPE